MPRTKSTTVSEKPVKKVLEKMPEHDSGIASIKETVDKIHSVITQPPPPPEKKQRAKRILTEEQKNQLRERLVKARAAKAKKKVEE